MSAINEDSYGEIFNVGMDKPTTFIELVKLIIKIAGRGKWKFTSFSPERKSLEPRDFYSDIAKIKETIGWYPKISLEDGLKDTVDYYKRYKHYYWEQKK